MSLSLKDITYYSVLFGPEEFSLLASISIKSLVWLNPGINYTIFLLGMDNVPKSLEGIQGVSFQHLTMEDYGPPECSYLFQSFWLRYAIIPSLLGTDWVAQVDTDLVYVKPLPIEELVPDRLNACIDVSIESSKQLLGTLNSYGWWVAHMYRRLYINAGLLTWQKSQLSWLFSEMSDRMYRDASIGVLDQAPFGDQPYINAILNRREDMYDLLHILPSKWNIGIWSESMLENVPKLIELKKAVAFHVFGAAGDSRGAIMRELYNTYTLVSP